MEISSSLFPPKSDYIPLFSMSIAKPWLDLPKKWHNFGAVCPNCHSFLLPESPLCPICQADELATNLTVKSTYSLTSPIQISEKNFNYHLFLFDIALFDNPQNNTPYMHQILNFLIQYLSNSDHNFLNFRFMIGFVGSVIYMVSKIKSDSLPSSFDKIIDFDFELNILPLFEETSSENNDSTNNNGSNSNSNINNNISNNSNNNNSTINSNINTNNHYSLDIHQCAFNKEEFISLLPLSSQIMKDYCFTEHNKISSQLTFSSFFYLLNHSIQTNKLFSFSDIYYFGIQELPLLSSDITIPFPRFHLIKIGEDIDKSWSSFSYYTRATFSLYSTISEEMILEIMMYLTQSTQYPRIQITITSTPPLRFTYTIDSSLKPIESQKAKKNILKCKEKFTRDVFLCEHFHARKYLHVYAEYPKNVRSIDNKTHGIQVVIEYLNSYDDLYFPIQKNDNSKSIFPFHKVLFVQTNIIRTASSLEDYFQSCNYKNLILNYLQLHYMSIIPPSIISFSKDILPPKKFVNSLNLLKSCNQSFLFVISVLDKLLISKDSKLQEPIRCLLGVFFFYCSLDADTIITALINELKSIHSQKIPLSEFDQIDNSVISIGNQELFNLVKTELNNQFK